MGRSSVNRAPKTENGTKTPPVTNTNQAKNTPILRSPE
jgi:hypothetical protein